MKVGNRAGRIKAFREGHSRSKGSKARAQSKTPPGCGREDERGRAQTIQTYASIKAPGTVLAIYRVPLGMEVCTAVSGQPLKSVSRVGKPLQSWFTVSINTMTDDVFISHVPGALLDTALGSFARKSIFAKTFWLRRHCQTKKKKKKEEKKNSHRSGRSLTKWMAVGKGNFCVVRRGQQRLKGFPYATLWVHTSELWTYAHRWFPASEI